MLPNTHLGCTQKAGKGGFAPISSRRWASTGSSAAFSSCGCYRYALSRDLGEGQGIVLFVMLNPSTADAERDDPTIRRTQILARGFGFRTLWVTNLFALRSTNPRRLVTHPDPVGPDNDRWIRDLARRTAAVILGWGNHGTIRGRGLEVLAALRADAIPVLALGVTLKREPHHPLFLPRNVQPTPF